MKLKDFDIKQVRFPKKPEKIDYFKAAVLYILKDGMIEFKECDNESESTLSEPKVKAIIKAAVPGHNSVLLNLEIMCNVDKYIIEDEKLDLRRKISSIADSIEKYVVV